LFISGTGATAGENIASNFGKLFAGSDYADPAYVNIPGNQLADIQVGKLNALIVLIESNSMSRIRVCGDAINYISAISGNKNLSMLSWSEGSLDGQWALTYWPSTRSIVSDFITISGDSHGTTLAYIVCPGFPQWKQQQELTEFLIIARVQLHFRGYPQKCGRELSIRPNNFCVRHLR